MKKTRKPLPKELFVINDEQGDGEVYLLAANTIDEFAAQGVKKVVGTYKLVREDVVTAVTKVSQRKVRRR